MVTGLSRGAGTSYIARNLAVVNTFSAAKTSLLVDCNFDSPSVAQSFGLTNGHLGLADYLSSQALPLENIVHSVGVPHLRCITIGSSLTESSRELITSIKFLRFINEIKNK